MHVVLYMTAPPVNQGFWADLDLPADVKARQDVFDMGIDVYNEECRKIVMRYALHSDLVLPTLIHPGSCHCQTLETLAS